ncbi:MAG: sensor histidine kinase [Sarcina sp.]
MSFKDYLADKIGFLVINIVTFLIIGSTVYVANFGTLIIGLIFIIWFLPLFIYIVYEYIKVQRYYKDLVKMTKSLDKKYLVLEVIKEPAFLEGKLIYNVLREITKSMNENVRDYKLQSEDYRDYIEAWVHEIKTPLASANLVIENNKNDITKKIENEIEKVDGFIEQVLYYSRSNNVGKDYIIKKINLKLLVSKVVRARAKDFIGKKISLELKGLEEEVYIDEKWFEFILNQIIQNSIKYSKNKDAKIQISSEKLENAVKLSIYDNGAGISEKDINRVFEKGFTGENGRRFTKSTGMGLYICKKLCDGLGMGLSISSKQDEFTKVDIIIPIGGVANQVL